MMRWPRLLGVLAALKAAWSRNAEGGVHEERALAARRVRWNRWRKRMCMG